MNQTFHAIVDADRRRFDSIAGPLRKTEKLSACPKSEKQTPDAVRVSFVLLPVRTGPGTRLPKLGKDVFRR